MTKLRLSWKMARFGEVVKNANLVERNPVDKSLERIVGLEHNDYVVTNQWICPQMTQIHTDEKSKNNLRPSVKSADTKRRFAIVLLVNGIAANPEVTAAA